MGGINYLGRCSLSHTHTHALSSILFHVSFKCDFTADCLYFSSVVESNFIFNIFEYVTFFFSHIG